jgi:hypothetical protein
MIPAAAAGVSAVARWRSGTYERLRICQVAANTVAGFVGEAA